MPKYLSTDPNAGEPAKEYLSTDPDAGEMAAAPKGALSRFGTALADAIPEYIRHPSTLAEIPGAIADVARERPMDIINPAAMVGRDIANASAESFSAQRAKGTNMASSLAAAVPVIGPASAQVGEEIGSGDYASALGHAIPLLAPFVAKGAAGAAEATGGALRAGARVGGTALKEGIKSGAIKGFDALTEGKGVSGAVATGLKAGVKSMTKGARMALNERLKHSLGQAIKENPAIAETLPKVESTAEGAVGEVLPFRKAEAAEKLGPKAPRKTVRRQAEILQSLGWTPEKLAKMSPAEIKEVIRIGETYPPGKPGPAAAIGRPATGRTAYGTSSKSPNERFAKDNTPNARVATSDAEMESLLQQSLKGPAPKSIKKATPVETAAQAVEAQAVELSNQGLSRVKIANILHEQYRIPESQANYMVAAIRQAYGLN